MWANRPGPKYLKGDIIRTGMPIQLIVKLHEMNTATQPSYS